MTDRTYLKLYTKYDKAKATTKPMTSVDYQENDTETSFNNGRIPKKDFTFFLSE